MSALAWVALLLGLGALLAVGRFALFARRAALPARHWMPLLLLQPIAAALLFLTLFPPQTTQRSDRLVIAGAGASNELLRRFGRDATVLALPEAPALIGAVRVPDLGTALRRYPQAAQLLVLGQGLPPRDRDAARGRALEFRATPLPRGLIDLQSPARASLGARWQVSGSANDLRGGSIELLDPAGRRADFAALPTDGRFQLHGAARALGRARFALRLRDAQKKIIEDVGLPIEIDPGTPLHLLVLAGGPAPELKYLRRWALDAGTALHTQISVGAGLRIGDAPIALDAASLRGYDLVLLDERVWRELGADRKAALREALHEGLGVLLRITGPLSAAERGELQALGFTVAPANIPQTTSLPAGLFDGTPKPGDDELPTLTRQALVVAAVDGVPLLRDESGAPLALWRADGQGRVALWWLGDTFRLALAGQSAAYGQLWSQTATTLARPRGVARPWLASEDPRPNLRLTICGLSEGATVDAPDGRRTRLLIDASKGNGCAAYWPSAPGWQTLRNQGSDIAFNVRASDEAPGLRARIDGEATRQLVSASATATARHQQQPGARWPWFLAWLLAVALLWPLERSVLRRA
jgi:hypothetical protein